MSTELGAFLRARRTDERLTPDTDGFGRRRITGLRREEVASTAGISVDYYTRLEQGRESNPSDSVVEALARVLRLDSDSVDHVYRLRASPGTGFPGTVSPDPHESDSDAAPEATARMTALVAAVRPDPAYVLNRLADVVAANPEGLAVLDGIADLPVGRRNTCRYLLTHPRAREVLVDWEDVARGAIAHLRAVNADRLQDRRLCRLVEELREHSLEFDRWWDGHLVQRRRAATERLRAPDGRVTTRPYEVLHLPEEGLRMTIWMPPGDGSPAPSP